MKKNTTIWILLLVLPIPVLIFNAIIQVVFRVGNNGHGAVILNIISLLLGVIATLALLGLPVWIIMLVQTTKHNKNLEQKPPAGPSAPLPPSA